VFASAAFALTLAASPVTELRQGPQGWQLIHDGKPFVIKGAGASLDLLDELREAGANTVRTWGMGDDSQAFLDRAHSLGLKVIAGVWLRKDPDFSYDDVSARRAQYSHAAEVVRKYKNHPAILMWAVGNEMELGAPDERVWNEVEHIARIFKRSDPNRPVMTVVADMWESKMKAILAHCPSIDLLGVNSYDGLPTLEGRMTDWKKPYVITEYAFSVPGGQKKTSFGLVEELNSTEKAASTKENTLRFVDGLPGRVLGGVFFHWSASSTQTASMHSAFLKTGEKLEVVDELTRLWKGEEPKNRAPLVESSRRLDEFGQSWEVLFADPDGDHLDLTLEIASEDPDKRFVGDFEQAQPVVQRIAVGSRFSLPAGLPAGRYRAYIIARDGQGGAAVWNHPFQRIGQ
jgi:hypothetical protein